MSVNALSVRWDILPYISGDGLDLGCGDARPHDWMVGVDKNPGTGARGPNLIIDARNLSRFSDKSQDYVFSSHLLNELEGKEKVLAEWWRLIKDDGYLILFLPLTDDCQPKQIVDCMLPLRPWQFVEARVNDGAFFHVYRKCERETTLHLPKPEKVCAVMKLGAHGDALWASSVFPHLKEQGYHVVLYTQGTGEEVLRHDPHIDELICFESRVPIGELGELFRWMETKYSETRILVECVEGTLLPSPQKIQYHFPATMRSKLFNFNYLDMHHYVAKVPLFPKYQKFYPNEEEMAWANTLRSQLTHKLVCFIPNGSSVSKMWPYGKEFVKRLLEENEDVTVMFLGDTREQSFDEHPRLMQIGLTWDVRKCMTICQLADVVIGQETGLLNSVAFNDAVHKIVLLSHSSAESLTRDWPNCDAIRTMPSCAGETACHRLHYDWTYCNKNEKTGAAECQSMITVEMVLDKVLARLHVEAIAA